MIDYLLVLLAGMVLGFFLGKICTRQEVSVGRPLTDEQLDHIHSVLAELNELLAARGGSVSPELPTEVPTVQLGEATGGKK